MLPCYVGGEVCEGIDLDGKNLALSEKADGESRLVLGGSSAVPQPLESSLGDAARFTCTP